MRAVFRRGDVAGGIAISVLQPDVEGDVAAHRVSHEGVSTRSGATVDGTARDCAGFRDCVGSETVLAVNDQRAADTVVEHAVTDGDVAISEELGCLGGAVRVRIEVEVLRRLERRRAEVSEETVVRDQTDVGVADEVADRTHLGAGARDRDGAGGARDRAAEGGQARADLVIRAVLDVNVGLVGGRDIADDGLLEIGDVLVGVQRDVQRTAAADEGQIARATEFVSREQAVVIGIVPTCRHGRVDRALGRHEFEAIARRRLRTVGPEAGVDRADVRDRELHQTLTDVEVDQTRGDVAHRVGGAGGVGDCARRQRHVADLAVEAGSIEANVSARRRGREVTDHALESTGSDAAGEIVEGQGDVTLLARADQAAGLSIRARREGDIAEGCDVGVVGQVRTTREGEVAADAVHAGVAAVSDFGDGEHAVHIVIVADDIVGDRGVAAAGLGDERVTRGRRSARVVDRCIDRAAREELVGDVVDREVEGGGGAVSLLTRGFHRRDSTRAPDGLGGGDIAPASEIAHRATVLIGLVDHRGTGRVGDVADIALHGQLIGDVTRRRRGGHVADITGGHEVDRDVAGVVDHGASLTEEQLVTRRQRDVTDVRIVGLGRIAEGDVATIVRASGRQRDAGHIGVGGRTGDGVVGEQAREGRGSEDHIAFGSRAGDCTDRIAEDATGEADTRVRVGRDALATRERDRTDRLRAERAVETDVVRRERDRTDGRAVACVRAVVDNDTSIIGELDLRVRHARVQRQEGGLSRLRGAVVQQDAGVEEDRRRDRARALAIARTGHRRHRHAILHFRRVDDVVEVRVAVDLGKANVFETTRGHTGQADLSGAGIGVAHAAVRRTDDTREDEIRGRTGGVVDRDLTHRANRANDVLVAVAGRIHGDATEIHVDAVRPGDRTGRLLLGSEETRDVDAAEVVEHAVQRTTVAADDRNDVRSEGRDRLGLAFEERRVLAVENVAEAVDDRQATREGGNAITFLGGNHLARGDVIDLRARGDVGLRDEVRVVEGTGGTVRIIVLHQLLAGRGIRNESRVRKGREDTHERLAARDQIGLGAGLGSRDGVRGRQTLNVDVAERTVVRDVNQAGVRGVEVDVAAHVDRADIRRTVVADIRRSRAGVAARHEDRGARGGAPDIAANLDVTDAGHALDRAVDDGTTGRGARGIVADGYIADRAFNVHIAGRRLRGAVPGVVRRRSVKLSDVRADDTGEVIPDGDRTDLLGADIGEGACAAFNEEAADHVDLRVATLGARAVETADEDRTVKVALDRDAVEAGAETVSDETTVHVVFERDVRRVSDVDFEVRREVALDGDAAHERTTLEGVVEAGLNATLGQPVATVNGGNVDTILRHLDALDVGPVKHPVACDVRALFNRGIADRSLVDRGRPELDAGRGRTVGAVEERESAQRDVGGIAGRATRSATVAGAEGVEGRAVRLLEVTTTNKDRLDLAVRVEHQGRNTGALGVDVTDRNDVLDRHVFTADTDNAGFSGEDSATHADAAHVGVTRFVLRAAHEDHASDVGETVVTLLGLAREEAGVLEDARGVNAEVRVELRLVDRDARQTLNVIDLLTVEELVGVFVGVSSTGRGFDVLEGDRHRALARELGLNNVTALIEERHTYHFAGISRDGDAGTGHQDLVVDAAVERYVGRNLRTRAGHDRGEQLALFERFNPQVGTRRLNFLCAFSHFVFG